MISVDISVPLTCFAAPYNLDCFAHEHEDIVDLLKTVIIWIVLKKQNQS